VDPGTQVDQHEVGAQPSQRAHQAHPTQMCRLRFAQVRIGTGDQLEPWNRGIEDQFVEIIYPLRDEIGEARNRCRSAEAGVEIRTFQIGIDGNPTPPLPPPTEMMRAPPPPGERLALPSRTLVIHAPVWPERLARHVPPPQNDRSPLPAYDADREISSALSNSRALSL